MAQTPSSRLTRALQRAVPSAQIRAEAVMLGGASLLEVDAGQGAIPLRAIWVGSGWPQDVREAVDSIGIAPEIQWPRDLVFVGRNFSTGAVELLKGWDANWVDETGRAEIVAPGLVVSRDSTRQPAARREFGWSASALGIAELLLSEPWPDGFGTAEIANRSGWSSPQVSQILQGFDENGWTVKHGPRRGKGSRRELIDVDGLLEAWGLVIESEEPLVREASTTVKDLLGFLQEKLSPTLNEHVRWALGGWAAAQVAAPFMTAIPTLQIYVHEDEIGGELSQAMREAELPEAVEGGRIQFIAAAPGVLSRSWQKNELPLVSAARIYADLLALGPRGVEAAENLREEVIDTLHRRNSSTGPPQELLAWEREAKSRLQTRIEESDAEGIDERYRYGTYSASYLLQGVSPVPSLPEFRKILKRAVGRETGWPAWQLGEGSSARTRPIDGAIECWFEENFFKDAAHADFWRADPRGMMCLIRGYDEDGRDAPIPPGSGIDLTLPVWRVAESLRHAGRLASLMDAARVQFMMRWEGLQGRKLANYAEPRRMLEGTYECAQDAVVTSLELAPGEIEPNLPRLVESLVAPLFAAFEFFEAPGELYEGEVERMRSRAA